MELNLEKARKEDSNMKLNKTVVGIVTSSPDSPLVKGFQKKTFMEHLTKTLGLGTGALINAARTTKDRIKANSEALEALTKTPKNPEKFIERMNEAPTPVIMDYSADRKYLDHFENMDGHNIPDKNYKEYVRKKTIGTSPYEDPELEEMLSIGHYAGPHYFPKNNKNEGWVNMGDAKFHHEDVLAHEIGHSKQDLDPNFHNTVGNHSWWDKVKDPKKTTLYEIERDAWNRAGIEEDNKIRQAALKTYELEGTSVRDNAIGAGVNITAGGVGSVLAYKRYQKMMKAKELLAKRKRNLIIGGTGAAGAIGYAGYKSRSNENGNK